MTPRPPLNIGRFYELQDNWSNWQGRCKYLGNKDGRHLFVFEEEDKKGYVILEDVLKQGDIEEGVANIWQITTNSIRIFNKSEIKLLGPETKPIIISLIKQLEEDI